MSDFYASLSDDAPAPGVWEIEVEARRTFAEENARLRDSAAALELLPRLLRRILLKKIRDARG